jgi:hypothetical protein
MGTDWTYMLWVSLTILKEKQHSKGGLFGGSSGDFNVVAVRRVS